MAILTKTRYVLAILFGFTIGMATVFWADTPVPEVEIKEIEKIVEKIVEVEKFETIEVPKIIYKTETIEVPKIVKEFEIKEVPVVKTRIVYLPGTVDTDNEPPVIDPDELYCMTLNIYREAHNQSLAGQIAVARVVLNRVQDRRYPAKVCDVIYEGPVKESWKTKKDPDLSEDERVYYPVRNRCQFSWYCDGKKDELINFENNIKWKVAEDIAYQVLAFNKWGGMIEGATHYHADYVNPTWRKQMQLIGKIDDHIFYRWD